MTDTRIIRVVATVWTDPDRVRACDGAAVSADPDVADWAAGMGREGRLDLHGRIVTQALPGEPVLVDAEKDGWASVVLPWQPSSLDPRGYPGWVRIEHLTPGDPDGIAATAVMPAGAPPKTTSAKAAEQNSIDNSADSPFGELPSQPVPGVDGEMLVATARRFLGLDYLWGGFTGYGVDCSGLTSLTHRSVGIVIPRDAHDQVAAGKEIELDQLQPGDLVFFGENEGRGVVHHVGMAIGDGTMLHAPRTGKRVEVCPLDMPGYAEELCAARRYV
jgi:cell wall-associated NlpC family hydrolase